MRENARSNALPIDPTGCADPKGERWLMSHECAEPASRHFQMKALTGNATADDLKMLRRACKYVGDKVCMECAARMLGDKPSAP